MISVPAKQWAAMVRAFRIVHKIAYGIWIGLLAARVAVVIAALALLVVDMAISRAHAQTSGGASTAQLELDDLLHGTMSAKELAILRGNCATGLAAVRREQSRAAGIDGAPVGAWCVTVMTRAAHDGALGYVRDPNAIGIRPSQSFDDGFVGGYFSREAIPNGAPEIGTLLPIANRCLAQSETNAKLCGAAGQILGMRAARGEFITLR